MIKKTLFGLLIALWASVASATTSVMGDANFQAKPSDTLITTRTPFSAPRTLTIPSVAGLAADSLTFVDSASVISGLNNLIIVTADGSLINGQSSFVVNAPGTSLSIIRVSNGYFIWSSNTQALNTKGFDFAGDSRTADVLVSPSLGLLGGVSGLNWFNQANALSGHRYQVGLVTASSGCRSDQYLYPDNIKPMLSSSNQWFVIGYPAVNDIGAVGNNCTIANASSTVTAYPYTNIYGVSVTQSNVANVVAGNLLAVVRSAIAAGKKVILLKEPGNTLVNNTQATVASFSGFTSTTTLTVNATGSGIIYTPQTVNSVGVSTPGASLLGGSGVTANTNIVAQLTGSDGAVCPAVSCTGGIGTYNLGTSQTISQQAFTATYSTLAALYDLNSNIDAIGTAYPGTVFIVNNNPALWNFTGSATAVTFRAGALIDGTTHYSVLGGYYGGVSFNAAMQNIILGTDIANANINDINTSNPRSLLNNPLFQTASGGVNTTCTLSSGTVPAGWTEVCGTSGISVTITQGADTNQLYGSAAVPIAGNAVTFALTSTGADLFRLFSTAPALTAFNLSDWLQGGMIVNVAASSSKCVIYGGLDLASNSATLTSYDLYGGSTPSGGGFNDGPTTAYTYTMINPQATFAAGSASKSFTRWILYVKFSAAGNCTVTVSRPFFNRTRVYNLVTNTFSGWLLMRDLGYDNDNSPVGLLKAG
jgi:hypothetical protein